MSSFNSISKRSLGFWVGGALLACGIAGCSGDPVRAESEVLYPGSGVIAGGTTALAADLASAPWQIAYHGVRRLEFHTEQPAVSYRETVEANGLGKFGIQVTEVLTAHYDAPGFLAKQAQNEGFNYRYRGFRVLDPFLFQTNYSVLLLNQDQMVAGVSCNRLLVQSRSQEGNQDANHYLVDMDPVSSLVLGWEERDSRGALLSRMEFESFGLGPAANPIPLGTGGLSQLEVSTDGSGGPSVPFHVLRPTLLPTEYRLFRTFQVIDKSANLWVRQVFTDGQGAIVFMHRKTGEQAGGARVASTVGVYEEGQWTVLMGDVNGYALLAVGKMGASEIEDMVSSCFR